MSETNNQNPTNYIVSKQMRILITILPLSVQQYN